MFNDTFLLKGRQELTSEEKRKVGAALKSWNLQKGQSSSRYICHKVHQAIELNYNDHFIQYKNSKTCLLYSKTALDYFICPNIAYLYSDMFFVPTQFLWI